MNDMKNEINIFSLAVTQQYIGASQKPHPALRSGNIFIIFCEKKRKNNRCINRWRCTYLPIFPPFEILAKPTSYLELGAL